MTCWSSVDGKRVSNFAELESQNRYHHRTGKEVKIGLLRKGKPLEVSVILDDSEGADHQSGKPDHFQLGRNPEQRQ